MADKTLTVNGQPFTFNRDRFAGVRTMEVTQPLTDTTTSIQVTVAGHSDLDGVYTGNGADVQWTQQGGNGRIATNGYNSENGSQRWFVYDINDNDPNGESNALFAWEPTHVSLFPWLDLPSSHNVTITPVPETVTVDRTASVIDSDRKGESRPLLSKVVGGAAAAYSLRDLNDKAGNNKVVRVRRASDNHERDFLAKEVSNGTLKNWVNVGNQYKGYSFFAPSASARLTLGSHIELLATNDWSMKFKVIMGEDSSNGYGILRNTAVSNNGSMFLPPTRNKLAFTNDSGSFINVNLTTSIGKGHPADIEIINEAGSGVTVKIDGVTRSSQFNIGDITFNSFANGRGRAGERVIFDVEVDLTGDGIVDHKYAGDGITNSNWADQAGSNNGTILNSTYITAYNNEFTDGFVETWYDQSGNGNDATQATAGNQPKIVNAGSLVAGGIDFLDGTNTHLDTTNSDICNVSQLSIFTVLTPFTGGSQQKAFSCGATVAGSTGYGGWVMNLNGYSDIASLQTQSKGNSALSLLSTDVTSSEALLSVVSTFPNASISKNSGTAVTSSSMVSPNQTSTGARKFRIGCQFTFNAAGFYTKPIREIILYTSDQSANRPAIEANINNQYEIY